MSSTNSVGSSSSLSSLYSDTALPTISNPSSADSTSSLSVAGLASGMNWQSTVQALAEAERAPETQWESQQSSLNTQNSDYTSLLGDLTTLQLDVETLQDPSLYESTTAQTSNSAIATATTNDDANTGTYSFDISQLATAAQINGTSNISQTLVPDDNPADVTLATAGFATPVTAGTFTVNGQQITVSTSESLQQVFDDIASATNNAVTAAYNSEADTITLSSSSPIVLGSATDTSNFLQVAGLYTNGKDSITSNSTLGSVQLDVPMSQSDLSTAITDGGSGNGAFTINGVTINYDASTDSIQDVLDDINNSAAGVTATYDTLNNRFVLTNNTTGNIGISLQDVSGQGNFLAATGLSSGTLQNGQNLLYTLNGNTSTQLQSESNTISSASSGITGLSVTALDTGSVTVTVASDTSAITTAVQQFVTDYNTTQSFLSTQQAVTTDSSGDVTPGPLTGDLTADDIVSGLSTAANGAVSGLSGTVQMLADLGIQTNGQNNTIALSDSSTLQSALTTNLSAVEQFFTDPTNGWATQMNSFINNTIGTNGTLTNHQATLAQESSDITTQINNLETKISNDSAQWTSEFEAMEAAESQVNQEMTYLSEQVSNGTL